MGVYYDDPTTVPESDLRSDACLVIDASCVPAAPARLVELAGGECAVYRHVGPYAELPQVWDRFYSEWLATGWREPADAPSYELYLNSPVNTPPAELATEIRIPLRPK